jgi:hypothetical protein
LGQRLHSAATKLPHIAPKMMADASWYQNGKALANAPVDARRLFRTGPFAQGDSRQRPDGTRQA